MQNLVRMFDEVEVLKSLKDRSLTLIKETDDVDVIKKLVSVHDIISMNLMVQENFTCPDGGVTWDYSALVDLRSIWSENFLITLKIYMNSIEISVVFFTMLILRKPLSFDKVLGIKTGN